MSQTRPHPAALLPRPFARGARAPISSRLPGVPAFSRFATSLDWRRALGLHRRLLAGDLSVMREVSRTESDTRPTLAVLLIGVLAASLGAWLWIVLNAGEIGHSALHVVLLGSLASLAAWGLWLAATRYALRSIFRLEVELRTLMRPLALVGGFAVWQFFLFAGPASFAVGLVVTIASVLLAVIAVRAAVPPADDRTAVISVGIGFGLHALALSLLADLAGVGSGLFVHAIG